MRACHLDAERPPADLEPDELFPRTRLRELLPRNVHDRACSNVTTWRWERRGRGGRKLRVVRLSGRSFTCWRWTCQFLLGTDPSGRGAPFAGPSDDPQRIATTEATLREAGIA